MLQRYKPMSRWFNGDAPKKCEHPNCLNQFDGAAFKGFRTGKYYCSRFCRADANDEITDQDRARLQ